MKKAIFLVGGPGSGKDIVLNKVLHSYGLQEFKIEQIKKESIGRNQSIVISTNAYNFEAISSVKTLLENSGFETSMIFVEVNNRVSKHRLSSRNVSEETLIRKLNESRKNIQRFADMFTCFTIFENNSSLQKNNIEELTLFCESFLNLENILFESNIKLDKKKILSRSIKQKLLDKTYPGNVLSKVQTDRIGDEYSIRNSGIGFPSTVGPFYSEAFPSYEPELPAFTSDSTSPRSIPPQEKYSENPNIETTKSRLKNIKKVAKACWSKGN